MNVTWLRVVMTRELASFERELELFRDEAQIWAVVPGVSNSAGNLTLHVCGNLRHFIGAVLGRNGYVRDRPLEFSARDLPRARLVAELRDTAQVIESVLPGLSPEVLAAEYPDVLGGTRLPTGLFLLQLSSHLAFHLGQVGYLRRVLTGENRSSDAVSIGALVEPPQA